MHGTEPGTAKGEGGINTLAATYLNRLSDLLFILARVANIGRLGAGVSGDVLWKPGGGREAAPEKRTRASRSGSAGSESPKDSASEG